MAPPKTTPNEQQLRKYLSRGLSQREIAEEWLKDSGHRVTRSAIGNLIAQYGLQSSTKRSRYEQQIPWRVAPEHRMHQDARMLRLEGRRLEGGELSESETRWLETWKEELKTQNAVIHYERNTAQGFFHLERRPEHGDDLIDRSNVEDESTFRHIERLPGLGVRLPQ